MRKYAEQVAEVIGLDTYSRSDFLLDENNHMYCLEANTLPGMTPDRKSTRLNSSH